MNNMNKKFSQLVFDSGPDVDPYKRKDSRLNVRSALESHRSKCDQSVGNIPEYDHRQTKRNSESQILQVKFSADVSAPGMERNKTEVSTLSPAIKIDHHHYEQWARVPGKKVTRSSLLRGIQQLKVRMLREERNGFVSGSDLKVNESSLCKSSSEFHIHQLKRNNLLTKEKLSEDKIYRIRKEKTCHIIDNTSSKSVFHSRNQLKTNSHIIDSGVFKEGEKCAGITAEMEVRLRNNDRDSAKLRHGMSRIRDRSSFPISVYQPVNIGDHVFLVNEPVRGHGILDFKKANKKETQVPSVLLLTDKSEENLINNSRTFQLDMLLGGKCTSAVENLQRSRATTGSSSLLQSRSQKRTQFMVSSAELYDFSQLSEIRHSMADKFLERSQTELLFPGRTLKMDLKSAMDN